jgi:DNA-binding response OmpR family regulator
VSRILIVEDDRALGKGVAALLKGQGHAADHVATGQAALELEGYEPYGLIILDVGLPDMSGFDVVAALRQRGSKVPVLLLTARNTVEDRVRGLDAGGDDYLLKPFDSAELLARVRALVRRHTGETSGRIEVGTLVCDPSSCTATLDGRPLDLRLREWTVLYALAARVGKVVSKEWLTAEIFGYEEPAGPNALEVYVFRVRKKLQPLGPEIRTLRGQGYMLVPD